MSCRARPPRHPETRPSCHPNLRLDQEGPGAWTGAAWPGPCWAGGMDQTPAHQRLVAFRGDVYAAPGHRKDSLFELLEAALTGPGRATLVRLSLEPAFRRAWPSA